MTHDNAYIDKIKKGQREAFVHALGGYFVSPEESVEDVNSAGANNPLEVSQRYQMIYKCKFYLLRFPFDQQVCNFTMKMAYKKAFPLHFVQDKQPLKYDGSEIVGEFLVSQIKTYTLDDGKETWFIFSVAFSRIYSNQLMATFFPICLIWLLCYLTFFIQIDAFNERIMVAITVLLVMVALQGTIYDELPKTSYYKFIDIWCLWFLTNIFCIAMFHIILEQRIKEFKGKDNFTTEVRTNETNDVLSIGSLVQNDRVRPAEPSPPPNAEHRNPMVQLTPSFLNQAGIITFPAMNIIFLIIYFAIQFWN